MSKILVSHDSLISQIQPDYHQPMASQDKEDQEAEEAHCKSHRIIRNRTAFQLFSLHVLQKEKEEM